MIIDDSRNVLAHLKAELHEESAVKASADMNIGDIVYLEMDENDGLTLRNGYATRRKYVVIIGKNEDTKETEDFPEALDEDLMKRTFEAAHQDDLASRCKTYEQVLSQMRVKYV